MPENDFLARLIDERDELSVRLDKLGAFIIRGVCPPSVSVEQWSLLHIQHAAMATYKMVLDRRIRLLDR